MPSTLNTFVTDLQRGSLISFDAWILLGGLIGFIGSKIVNKTGHGLVRDMLLSILGAIFGGFLANLLGDSQTACLDRYSLFVAAVGALVFLITYHGMFRRGRTPSEVTLMERFSRRSEGKGGASKLSLTLTNFNHFRRKSGVWKAESIHYLPGVI